MIQIKTHCLHRIECMTKKKITRKKNKLLNNVLLSVLIRTWKGENRQEIHNKTHLPLVIQKRHYWALLLTLPTREQMYCQLKIRMIKWIQFLSRQYKWLKRQLTSPLSKDTMQIYHCILISQQNKHKRESTLTLAWIQNKLK